MQREQWTNAFAVHLGDGFDQLSTVVRNAHSGTTRLEGSVTVRRGRVTSSFVANLLGMPKSRNNCQLTMEGIHHPREMVWHRCFDGEWTTSRFVLDGEFLREKLGPMKLWLKVRPYKNGIRYYLEKTTLGGISIPRLLSPRLFAFEVEHKGTYAFGVKISLPVLGTLVEYFGRLKLLEHE